MHSFRPVLLVTAALMLLGPSVAQAHVLRHPPRHKRTATTSTNWSGYAVDGSGATDVLGTWTQPTATCANGENSWSSPWIGIDGDTSNTVEQTGTDSDCVGGTPTYYAWYEMYPKNVVEVNLAVHPGDSFTGEVKYTGSSFTLTLIDTTTGKSFTTTQSARKAQRSSVEWIMEGPTNSGLTDFGSIPFTSSSATISNQTGGLSSFSNPQQITMTSNSGVVRALPSAQSNNAFGVTWRHS
jgi:hypothetical protein